MLLQPENLYKGLEIMINGVSIPQAVSAVATGDPVGAAAQQLSMGFQYRKR